MKYLVWIPVIGLLFEMYAQEHDWDDCLAKNHNAIGAIWHGVWLALVMFYTVIKIIGQLL